MDPPTGPAERSPDNDRPAAGTDEAAIRRTLAQYCQTCDDGRFEEFGDLFVEDGVLDVGGREPIVGRQSIRAFMARAQPPERRGKHLCGMPVIDIDGDEATASTDFVFVARTGDGGRAVTAMGRYHDRLLRDHGAWRFAQRTIALSG